MDLTVVVLTYDSAGTIERCLDSLARRPTRPPRSSSSTTTRADRTLAAGGRRSRAQRRVPVRVLRNGSHNISRGPQPGSRGGPHRPGGVPGLRRLRRRRLDRRRWSTAFAADAGVRGRRRRGRRRPRDAVRRRVAVNDATVRQLATSGCTAGQRLQHGGAPGGGRRRAASTSGGCTPRTSSSSTGRVGALGDRAGRPGLAREPGHRRAATGRQMYRYGMWKVRYAIHTGDVRLGRLHPAVAMLVAAAAGLLGVTVAAAGVPGPVASPRPLVVAALRRPARGCCR